MISKDRIMVMIELAMMEDEYGPEVTFNGPIKREYVGGHMFMFFFVETLLYLFIVGAVFASLFMTGRLNFAEDELFLIGGAILVFYLILTYLGLFMVRRSALKKYRSIVAARKEYKAVLEELYTIIENEHPNN